MRKMILWILVGIAVSYVTVAVSPLKKELARQHPRAATYFSPWLNFSAEYDSGRVLDFYIGMNREDLRRAIVEKYSGLGELNGSCVGITKANSDIAVTGEATPEMNFLMDQNTICFGIRSKRISAIIYLKEDIVRRISLSVIRTDLIM